LTVESLWHKDGGNIWPMSILVNQQFILTGR
jgi:hypothetical protein